MPRTTGSICSLLLCFLAGVPVQGGDGVVAPAGDKPDQLVDVAPDTEPAGRVDFEQQIRPLLQAACGDCHGPAVQKGGLRLDARHTAMRGGDGGPVWVAGRSADSELLRRVTSTDPDERMPPDGPALTPPQTELLRRWIDAGAVWPETDYDRQAAQDPRLQHWSFQALADVPLPAALPEPSQAVIESGAVSRDVLHGAAVIDGWLSARLAEQGLQLSPAADRRTLLRRVFYDLTGLPPTPEQVAAFTADSRPEAWSTVVEQLLASPRYGERWGQHWLDIIRYADTHGFEVNTPRDHAWRYRDYVIQSFNEDKPYDRFVLEQLAGDVLGADAATGFLVAAAVLLPGQIGADDASKRLARQDALDEIIAGTSSTLLGLTIACARCHDHKFDPITSQDYYALQACFAGVEYGDRPVRSPEQQQQLAEAAALVPQITALEQQLRSLEPPACTGRTLIIDEVASPQVTFLKASNGEGVNPEGTQRGYRDDPGSATQPGNLSGGRYTWWTNVPGEDVLTWQPGVSGQFRLWLSWGAHGSGVHTRDARYLLDQDGQLTTRADQRELAQVDQYYPAGVTTGETPQQPLWSGLQDVGVVTLQECSKLVLRGGETGTGITADVLVLQEVVTPADAVSAAAAEVPAAPLQSSESRPALPQLRAPVSALENSERFDPVDARFVRFTTLETINNNQHEPCLDELEVFTAGADSRNVALASTGARATSSGNYSETGIHQLRHVHDGQYGNDRSWISSERGGGWVQIQLADVCRIERVQWSRDRRGKFQDRLPVRYTIEVSLDGRRWITVATGADRVPAGMPYDVALAVHRRQSPETAAQLLTIVNQLQELKARRTQLETPQLVYGGVFREPDTTFVLRRGDPEQPVEEIRPAVPAVFTALAVSRQSAARSAAEALSAATATAASADAASVVAGLSGRLPPLDSAIDISSLTADQQRRLALARWIASADNPLTARVMVNRIWLYHFGQGLTDTPSDFGVNGSRPSHPELLDWLAGEFIRSGWSVRHLHRLILHSTAYRQSHALRPDALAVDRDNRLLWHFGSRRLEAECVRDAMLAVSGELNLQMGGPGFNFFKARGGLDGFPPLEDFTPNELRRMVYAHKVRMEQVPVFGAFDCPDAGQAMPRRSQSTTAIQALNLLNSRFVIERAERLAARVAAEVPDAVAPQVTRAFQLCYGREPTSAELTAASSAAERAGLAAVCRALLNSSEFLFIP